MVQIVRAQAEGTMWLRWPDFIEASSEKLPVEDKMMRVLLSWANALNTVLLQVLYLVQVFY